MTTQKLDVRPKDGLELLGGPSKSDLIGGQFFGQDVCFSHARGEVFATIEGLKGLDRSGDCWEITGKAQHFTSLISLDTMKNRKKYRVQFSIKQRRGWLQYLS